MNAPAGDAPRTSAAASTRHATASGTSHHRREDHTKAPRSRTMRHAFVALRAIDGNAITRAAARSR